MQKFNSISDLDLYVEKLVKQYHPDDFNCIFLGGSFVRKTQTLLSDIDYTACANGSINHSRFYFEIIEIEKILRLLSIYFFEKVELLPKKEAVGDEEYLWMKKMLPNTRFVSGNKTFYNKVAKFYSNLEYSRKPKHKTIHKSYGKLLELIARIKKWHQKDNFVEMAYYGEKLAEHVRRLVVEMNGPMSVTSENFYLDAHFELPLLPDAFKELYLTLNRYSSKAISPDQYEKACIDLVINTSDFLKKHKAKLDEWTIQLLENPNLKSFLLNMKKENFLNQEIYKFFFLNKNSKKEK